MLSLVDQDSIYVNVIPFASISNNYMYMNYIEFHVQCRWHMNIIQDKIDTRIPSRT